MAHDAFGFLSVDYRFAIALKRRAIDRYRFAIPMQTYAVLGRISRRSRGDAFCIAFLLMTLALAA